MVVVRIKVEIASTGADAAEDDETGEVPVTSVDASAEQPTAPGQSRVIVTVPV